ncbi:MAG: DNA repair protein RecO [Kiritimatiellia bacterium]
MIVKTNAIALQIRGWSKTSHMVIWLTEDYGKITTVVKGACRPKSAFLGQYDLFYTCELLFYRRGRDGTHMIRECTPLQCRAPLRSNWRGVCAAGYLAYLTARTTTGHEAKALYADLSHALDTLCDCDAQSIAALIFWFEMRLLLHHGISPDFRTCPQCHPAGAQWLRFSIESGRFACAHFNESHIAAPSVTLHRDVIKCLRRFAGCHQFKARHYTPIMTLENKNNKKMNLVLGLSRFLGIFIIFHLDLPAAVRRVAFESLNTNPTSMRVIGE